MQRLIFYDSGVFMGLCVMSSVWWRYRDVAMQRLYVYLFYSIFYDFDFLRREVVEIVHKVVNLAVGGGNLGSGK